MLLYLLTFFYRRKLQKARDQFELKRMNTHSGEHNLQGGSDMNGTDFCRKILWWKVTCFTSYLSKYSPLACIHFFQRFGNCFIPFSQTFFGLVHTHSWTYEITALLSSTCTPSKSLLSLSNKKEISWGYIWTIRWVGKASHFASWWFEWFSWQCEASHCLEGRKSDFLLFSSWTGTYPLLLPTECWNNILRWWLALPIIYGVIDVRGQRLCGVFSSLSLSLSSLPSLKVLQHSNTRVLERHIYPNCYFEPLENFRWLYPFCSTKFYNNALFHANRQILFTHLSCRA